VDDLAGYADDVEVDDRAAAGAIDDVDHTSEERLLGITGDDDRARQHPARLAGLVEEGPHEAGLVDLLHVGGQGHDDGALIAHGCLLTWCGFVRTSPSTSMSCSARSAVYGSSTTL